ncbi:MAG: (deoxy)nucleoside triphosphate pyrophosphohydrolase [Clostridia bacterium]|nr:(deoxy)nucleoside triphosphate pyrophosphohydrolase [Clostridia bacterium]
MKTIKVVAALIRDGGKIMICRRPAGKARGMLWEFPGGKIEPDEEPEQALVRECREELDIGINAGRLFLTVRHEYPDITVELSVYESVITEGTPKLLEHSAIAFITPKEADDYEFCPADVAIIDRIKAEAGK